MHLITYLMVALQLILVAYLDFRRKKISNFWPLLNLVVYLLHLYYYAENYPLKLEHFVFPLGFIVFGFGFFLLNIMGPGDSKYLASLFLLINVNFQIFFFLQLVYWTIVAGLFLLLFNSIKNFDKIKKAFSQADFAPIKGVFGTKFTYAPIIFCAWVSFGWKIEIFSI